MGFEGDAGGLPRILLHSEELFTPGNDANLQIDCQWVGGRMQLELYVAREVFLAPERFGPPPSQQVKYSIDGVWGVEQPWDPSEYSTEFEGVFAPRAQAEELIAALKDGAQEVWFRVYWSGTNGTSYQFLTEGFNKAFEPVEARCG